METMATTTTGSGASTGTTTDGCFHSLEVNHLQHFLNRAFALIYLFAILALFYHHTLIIINSTTFVSLSISILMLIADVILAFMWSTTQACRVRPVTRKEYPEKLKLMNIDFPGLDIFICTADPYKEPPLNVVNTALSVMAYDYEPIEKVSVYVSDDGGSELTFFAFLEAAKFAVYWLPFCRENGIIERCPEAYFSSDSYAENSKKIKLIYESMKRRIENVVERGKVDQDFIKCEEDRRNFEKFWTEGFTRQNHPSIIQVLLESGQDNDITGHGMPNLIYISREKNKSCPHHFKAGALNTLLRVSGIMTNAPLILTLDCDMYSNDPSTPLRALCYHLDQKLWPTLAYVQFPQRFHGLNEADIYGNEIKGLFHTNAEGMDGLKGPNYVGTGSFFRRRAFFGSPSLFIKPEIPELLPDNVVAKKPIQAQENLQLAEQVAGCNYESCSDWGSKIGFRYGSLVEDYYTGYRLQCEGWKSIFCNPKRPAFLGDAPIALYDALNQIKRWDVGLYEVNFSKYSPLTFGARCLGRIMAHCYAHYACSPFWSVPISLYAFIPQLTLLNEVAIFPKISDSWFFLYLFLFLGAYGQDCFVFISAQGTWKRWWSDQRIWMIRGLSTHLFGTIEYLMKILGIPTQGFNVTSKVVDDDQGKRYRQGIFEFGVVSPMFVILATTSIVNLVAFIKSLLDVFKGKILMDGLFIQMFIAGFVVINCLPIYEAMVLRVDKGRMPTRITIISTFLAGGLYIISTFLQDHV